MLKGDRIEARVVGDTLDRMLVPFAGDRELRHSKHDRDVIDIEPLGAVTPGIAWEADVDAAARVAVRI